MFKFIKVSLVVMGVIVLSGCIRNPMPAGSTSTHPSYNQTEARY